MITAIGIAYTGDAEDRTARSGTPFGVLTGVRAQGLSAHAVKATLPKNADRAVAAVDATMHLLQCRHRPSTDQAKALYQGAHLARATSMTRSLAVRLRPTSRRVDAAIALGSGYSLPRGLRYAIYDDMTVRQAIDLEYPAWTAMRESDRDFRLAQQRRIYERAVACCMTTSWAAESVVRDYGIPENRVIVVGAGTHEERRRVTRDWSVPRYLFVGLDWKRKNGPRVLEAFRKLRSLHPEATLDVVGGHPDIDEPGVTGHGKLYRNDPVQMKTLTRLYDKSTCFVMPSIHEPGGVVLIEAAATGIGCIAGTRGGSRDFVGDAGIMVDPFSDDEIFEAMVAFSDPDRARQMGALAFERSELFTWPQVAGRILRAIDVSFPLALTAEAL